MFVTSPQFYRTIVLLSVPIILQQLLRVSVDTLDSIMLGRGRILEKLALTLTLAGGVSNLYDRMKRGYVVDYFSFQWKALKKVVFNLGDLFIFAGAFLMAAGTAAGFLKDLIMDLYGKTEEK